MDFIWLPIGICANRDDCWEANRDDCGKPIRMIVVGQSGCNCSDIYGIEFGYNNWEKKANQVVCVACHNQHGFMLYKNSEQYIGIEILYILLFILSRNSG